MPNLILVRLHPGQQTAPSIFRTWLDGLEITAYDTTVC
jgi:hypothetical protein